MKNYKILKTTLPITLIKHDHETEFATIDKLHLQLSHAIMRPALFWHMQ